MLQRIHEQQAAIRAVLASDRKATHLIPTWQDFDVIESVIAALKPFEEFTDVLSAENSITISAIGPLLKRICGTILVGLKNDTSLTKHIKTVVRHDLETRYSDSDLLSILDISTFLDIFALRLQLQKNPWSPL